MYLQTSIINQFKLLFDGTSFEDTKISLIHKVKNHFHTIEFGFTHALLDCRLEAQTEFKIK